MSISTKAGQIHYDRLLSNYAANYQSQKAKFIHNIVSPSVIVDRQADKFAKFTAKGSYDTYNSLRAKNTKSNIIDNFGVDSGTYFCDEHSLSAEIAWQDMKNSEPIIQQDTRQTAKVLESLLLAKEINIASKVFNSANFGANTSAAAAKWTIATNPREEVRDIIRTVSKKIGVRPNLLVINDETRDALIENPYIQSYLSSNVDKNIDEMVLQRFFGIEKVVIGEGYYNSAKQGQAVSMSPIWGKNCLIAYINPTADINDASFSKTFIWNGYGNAITQDRGIVGVRSWDDEELKMRKVEAEMNYTPEITFLDSAYLLTSVID